MDSNEKIKAVYDELKDFQALTDSGYRRMDFLVISKLQEISDILKEIYAVIPDVGKVRSYKENY